jgi:hypothetical protein
MNFTEKSIKQDAITLGARFNTRFSGCPHYKIAAEGAWHGGTRHLVLECRLS